MTDLSTWLNQKLAERNWSIRAAATEIGASHQHLARIISGESRPSPELATAIARVFRVPPEQVFRRAGLLPPLPDLPGNEGEIIELVGQIGLLEQKDRDSVTAIVAGLLALREREARVERLVPPGGAARTQDEPHCQ